MPYLASRSIPVRRRLYPEVAVFPCFKCDGGKKKKQFQKEERGFIWLSLWFDDRLKDFQKKMSCGVCKKPVLDTDMQLELDCKRHVAHAHHESFDCIECATQIGASVTASGKGDVSVIDRRKQLSAARIEEPLGANRQDSARLQESSSSSTLKNVFSKYVVPLFARTGAPVESLPPRELLAQKIPLADVVGKYGYDITELINDHELDINDFFEHGYTVGEMMDAFSSRMNQKDGLNVLSALGIQAEHFRCVPDLVMADAMKKKIGYKPSDLVDRFHFQYKSPVTHPDEAWTLQEMIDAGLTFEDVRRAGLQCEVQWKELKQTVAPLSLSRLEKQFGITPELVQLHLVPEAVTAQMANGYLNFKEQQEQEARRMKEAEQARAKQQFVMSEIVRHHTNGAAAYTPPQGVSSPKPGFGFSGPSVSSSPLPGGRGFAAAPSIEAVRRDPLAFHSMLPLLVQQPPPKK